jgi:AcrR family transcriptional regulator
MSHRISTSTEKGSAIAKVAKSVDKLSDRGRRTRAQLLEAAQRVFERNGFVEVRVADIVTEAGVAHGTFYTYFSSKEEIFRAVIEVHQSTIEQAAAGSSIPQPNTPRARIEASNRAYIEGYAKHSRLMELWMEASVLHADLGDLLEELIIYNIKRTEHFLRELKRAKLIARDVDPAYAARALNAMVMQFSIRIFHDGADKVNIDKAVRTITDIWCRGIGLDSDAH